MPWPPKRRGPRLWGTGRDPRRDLISNSNNSDPNIEIPISQLRSRPIGPGELASLRAMWWAQASAGHRLPAEIDVIVIEGGAHDSICG